MIFPILLPYLQGQTGSTSDEPLSPEPEEEEEEFWPEFPPHSPEASPQSPTELKGLETGKENIIQQTEKTKYTEAGQNRLKGEVIHWEFLLKIKPPRTDLGILWATSDPLAIHLQPVASVGWQSRAPGAGQHQWPSTTAPVSHISPWGN